jgi:hypothetical protein
MKKSNFKLVNKKKMEQKKKEEKNIDTTGAREMVGRYGSTDSDIILTNTNVS